MNDLTIFKNEDFGEVRTVILNDEIWFVAKDVCSILEIQNTTQALESLDSDERSMFKIGRQGESNIINESGLYALIIKSRKPEAKRFRKWITSEVIPQIRKTGTYTQMPKSYAEALRAFANEVEQKELMQKQRDEAIRTKAWISDKKTATAMNTASRKVKEAKKLKAALDLEMSYATVKKVESATGRKYKWRKLKEYCESAGLGWNKAFDSNYGSVNSYPAEAWKNVYGIKLKELF